MKSKEIALRIFRMILGLFFVADGVIKLTGISHTVELFEKIKLLPDKHWVLSLIVKAGTGIG